MAEMRTSYGELVTSWWRVVGNLRTICGITFQSIASNYQQSLKLRKAAPSSADKLPHFWHRCGTDVAISWRKKMSSKVLPKNRVMCLKNLGGVWGGCLPIATLELRADPRENLHETRQEVERCILATDNKILALPPTQRDSQIKFRFDRLGFIGVRRLGGRFWVL